MVDIFKKEDATVLKITWSGSGVGSVASSHVRTSSDCGIDEVGEVAPKMGRKVSERCRSCTSPEHVIPAS